MKTFVHNGIKVIIRSFNIPGHSEPVSFAAEFYENEKRLRVVHGGWNVLLAKTEDECVENSKKFIDLRKEGKIAIVNQLYKLNKESEIKVSATN